MNKHIFITGTGTDVGKTYVSGLLLKRMHELGWSSCYYKAAMSGNIRDTEGKLIPGDALCVKNISGIPQDIDTMCPYVYENAVSPHLASRIEGNPVKMKVVKEQFHKLCGQYDYTVVEGSGGILCPLGFDEEKIQLEDVVKELSLASLIVADAGLGTINYVVLTVEYMKQKKLPIHGLIFNHYHPGNVMEEDNIKMCELMTGIPCVARVKADDSEMAISEEALRKIFEAEMA